MAVDLVAHLYCSASISRRPGIVANILIRFDKRRRRSEATPQSVDPILRGPAAFSIEEERNVLNIYLSRKTI